MQSEYMQWAKACSAARFNLATSGLSNLKLKELRVSIEDLEITGDGGYGYAPLQTLLATRLRVPTDCLVTAAGTSFANHLAMAALIGPGDQVLIERPTYEPLVALARYLAADIKRFERRFEEGFQIVVEQVERSITSRTRLVVVTNLHNPTSVLADEGSLRQLGQLASGVNARVLVDEVYLEGLFAKRPPPAFHYGREFVVTSSLTKAFGLSGLRCGWIVAEPSLARKMWLLDDLFAATPVHAGERLSVVALQQIDELSLRAERLLNANRALATQFFEARDDLEMVRPRWGTTLFPRLRHGPADRFCDLLRTKYETSVVPGRFFEAASHFRVGLGGDTETLAAGLERIDAALNEFSTG